MLVTVEKNEKEFDEQYQYGQISEIHRSRDGHIRKVDIKYKNANENTFRVTNRGVRELVLISPVDDVDIYERLDHMIFHMIFQIFLY